MKKITYVLIFSLLPLIAGCLSSVPKSSGLYGDTPGRQEVSGSNVQVVESRTVSYNSSEVADAIAKSFNMMGLDFEFRDEKKGLYTGSGGWNAPGQMTPCVSPYSFAAYVIPLDNKPTTKLTVLIDRHTYCGAALKPERLLMNQVMGQFSKIISTY